MAASPVLTAASASRWLRSFWPAPLSVDWHERARAVAGAAIGIFVTAWICRGVAGDAASWPWLVAPLGASAVLVFAVPSSPLAQPWSVIGGNTLSALVGVACVHAFGGGPLAAGLAVGGAIALMFALRCLHPPGGASALLVALLGVADPRFALAPVLLNSVLLAAAGVAYNNATRRSYPHRPMVSAASHGAARDAEAEELEQALDALLHRYNQVLDIDRADLRALIEDTRLGAYQRRLTQLRCRDIMSTELVTVNHATPIDRARSLLLQHHLKALPVVDGAGGIVGIVTHSDMLRSRSRQSAEGAPAVRPTTVGQIMTREVRVASAERHLADLIPLFGGGGHHHIPVVDTQQRLCGIITQSDVVAALSRSQGARTAG